MSKIGYPDHVKTKSDQRMFDDFKLFLWYLWRELGLPEPTKRQYEIADYLQHGPRRRIILAFRGVGKSWITAAFVCWLLWKNPQERIMILSANEERAIAFSRFVRKLIEMIPLLAYLRPKGGSVDSLKGFDVGPATPDQAPSVRSLGITGQLTGGRASVIIADDIEIPKNSATETMREKISEAVKEFDAVLKPGGQVVYLGTPQIAQSLYVALESRGYETMVWPARFPPGEKARGYRGRLAPTITAEVTADPTLILKTTDPARFSDLDLAEREASYGRSGFALQFMLDTSLSDAERYPLKIDDLIVMDVDRKRGPVALTWASGKQNAIPELPNLGFNGDRFHAPMYVSQDFAEFQGTAMHIDPSGRGKDETAYCVTKMLNGVVFVRRWGGLQGGYDETVLSALAMIAKEEAVNEVWVEDNYGDGMFTALLRPVMDKVHPVHIEGYKVSGQKETRIIDTLEPVLNQHRLVLDKRIVEQDHEDVSRRDGEHSINYSGLYQLSHLTRDRGSLKQDDRIDVMGAAVKHWTSHLDQSQADAEKRHKAKLQDVELRKFMKHVIGRTPPKRRWTQA